MILSSFLLICSTGLEILFSNKNFYTTIHTVDELINELKLLPKDLPVKQCDSDSADIVLLNRDSDTEYVAFEPGGSWAKMIDGE